MISGMVALKRVLAHVFPMDPSHGAFADLWVRVCVPMCVHFMPGGNFACQLLADLVLKRMHVVCLYRRVNLWIRSD